LKEILNGTQTALSSSTLIIIYQTIEKKNLNK